MCNLTDLLYDSFEFRQVWVLTAVHAVAVHFAYDKVDFSEGVNLSKWVA